MTVKLFWFRTDLEDRRVVDVRTVGHYAETIDADYLETSAKDNQGLHQLSPAWTCPGVEELFISMGKKLIEKAESSPGSTVLTPANSQRKFQVSSSNAKTEKRCCGGGGWDILVISEIHGILSDLGWQLYCPLILFSVPKLSIFLARVDANSDRLNTMGQDSNCPNFPAVVSLGGKKNIPGWF